MNLINVTQTDSGMKVDGRELHEFLEVGKVFAAWIQERIVKYGFVEGEDFFPKQEKTSENGRPRIDYELTIEMAKELCMVENNEKGKQARKYFIECEKRLKQSNVYHLPQTMAEALRLAADLSEQNERIAAENERLAIQTAEQQQKLREQEAPVAIYNLAIAAQNTQSMADVAKALGTGRTRLFNVLREERIIPQGRTVPYQRFIEAGYFVVRERPRASGDTVINDPVPRVTAKGFDYIARLLQKRQGA